MPRQFSFKFNRIDETNVNKRFQKMQNILENKKKVSSAPEKKVWISKEDLRKIWAELPNGAIVRIAKETGFTRPQVSNILAGKRAVNFDTIVIIECAKRLIDDFAARCEAVKIESNSN